MTFRSLRRRPIATIVIVSTLALGLGAMGVITALLSAVLFPRMPYREPARLAVLMSSSRPGATEVADYLTPTRSDNWMATPPRSAERLTRVGSTTALLRLPDATHRITLGAVSGSFFELLGSPMARGRALTQLDSASGTPGVVLSDRAWRRYFMGDRAIVGQTIALDSAFFTVQGVAPAEFDYPRGVDGWILRTQLSAESQPVAWQLLARLRSGVGFDAARAEFIARSQSEQRTDSIANAGQGVTAIGMGTLERNLGNSLFPLISICLAALFLIAMLNLGILLLLQLSARARELAIRTVLGSGRWGAIKPVVQEIGLQFAIGCGLALVVSSITLSVIRNRLLFELAPITGQAQVALILAVLSFGLLAALLTIPLVIRRSATTDVFAALRRSGEAITLDPGSHRLRRVLVGAEIAVAIALACSAGVVGKALRYYRSLEIGYDAKHAVVARPDYLAVQYDHERQLLVGAEARAQLLMTRGVTESTYWRGIGQAFPPPRTEYLFAIDGKIIPRPNFYTYYEVGPRFLETLNAPVTEGRSFNEGDRRGAPLVAIINTEAARTWFPGEPALGRRVTLNPGDPSAWMTIIGVTRIDALHPIFDRQILARGRARPLLMRPIDQAGPHSSPYWNWDLKCFVCPSITIAARAPNAPGLVRESMKGLMQELEPGLPIMSVSTIYEEQVGNAMGKKLEQNARTMIGFAALAVLLAMLGVYGVIADGVAARTRELAIRSALGASGGRLLRMVLRENVVLAVVAIISGAWAYYSMQRLAGGLIFGGANRFLLFQQSPLDPLVIAPLLVVVFTIVVCAVLMGSRNALRVDPRAGLQSE